MNTLFLTLFGEELLPAGEFLSQVFRIQFWFIHVMPFIGFGGSDEFFPLHHDRLLQLSRQRHRPAVAPIAPPLMDYFPDLEALFCCSTEDDFVDLSMTEIYCVNYTAYCD